MKTTFFTWIEPHGYHRFDLFSTTEFDDSPGNQFKVEVYFDQKLVGETTIDAPKTYNPRQYANRIAKDWFGSLVDASLGGVE